MSAARPGPHNLQGLPTLTEVIDMPPRAREAGVEVRPAPLEATPFTLPELN